jgi:hypothetical protein
MVDPVVWVSCSVGSTSVAGFVAGEQLLRLGKPERSRQGGARGVTVAVDACV